jgi:hypothetical protein
MITVEFFEPQKHYETVAGWWAAQDWPVMPLTHLPKTGFVVSHQGKPACAGWLYKTDSAMCWLEFIVASPEIRHEPRSAVLSVLVSSARMAAELMGFQTIFMSTASQSLGSRLGAHGFKASDKSMTNYVCDLSRRSD